MYDIYGSESVQERKVCRDEKTVKNGIIMKMEGI
jgi:hypothetical protein